MVMVPPSLSSRRGSTNHEDKSISAIKILRGIMVLGIPVLVIFQTSFLLSMDESTLTSASVPSSGIRSQPPIKESVQEGRSGASIISGIKMCTSDQLSMIEKQLSPADCKSHINQPWSQRCSFSYATQCPDAIWVEELYRKKHMASTSSSQKLSENENYFTGIFVGCNKGMDAVNTLRMGSGNPKIEKEAWRNAMTKGGETSLANSVCNQANLPQFELEEDAGASPVRNKQSTSSGPLSQVHCIEPMPATYQALSQSAKELHYDTQGLVVTHAAISKEDGTVAFPSAEAVGKENRGISTCKGKKGNGSECVDVNMFSLDTYVTKFINHDGPIHFLSIDVEGYDMDVMLGGSSTLERVHYLEFEYNWMGSWSKQKLSDAIHLLDKTYNFTCYWPGYDGNIWRITACWLDHYELHYWANVACVKRGVDEVKQMADDMERMFLKTMEKGSELVLDYDHRGVKFQYGRTG